MSSFESNNLDIDLSRFKNSGIIMPETSPVGLRFINSAFDVRAAKTLASMNPDDFHALIAARLVATGNVEDLAVHNDWLVGYKSKRLVRKIEHFVAGIVENTNENPKPHETVTIPLCVNNDLDENKQFPWVRIDDEFRTNVSHNVARLLGVEHQPIPKPSEGIHSEIQLGWLAIKNTVLLDVTNQAHTSFYRFAVAG